MAVVSEVVVRMDNRSVKNNDVTSNRDDSNDHNSDNSDNDDGDAQKACIGVAAVQHS